MANKMLGGRVIELTFADLARDAGATKLNREDVPKVPAGAETWLDTHNKDRLFEHDSQRWRWTKDGSLRRYIRYSPDGKKIEARWDDD